MVQTESVKAPRFPSWRKNRRQAVPVERQDDAREGRCSWLALTLKMEVTTRASRARRTRPAAASACDALRSRRWPLGLENVAYITQRRSRSVRAPVGKHR